MAIPDLKPLNTLFSTLPTTIFTVMSTLAAKHNAINLGQGFPDDEGPESMKRLVGSATLDQHNQYTHTLGLPELREALAAHSQEFYGLPVDPASEVLVTAGASEALTASFLGLLNVGDEVIVLDPTYDLYAPAIERAGGTVVAVPLSLEDWSIPREPLSAAFGPKTKAILINTPHNPTGKVFSREDLEFVAGLIQRHGAYAILDEVYEHLVFSGSRHVTLRSLPGMAERAIRIGSAGKTFSLTNWKVGWITGPAPLMASIAKAHQFITFCLPGNLQTAVAYGLKHESQFYRDLGHSLQLKKDYLASRLAYIGFRVLPTQGTYFLLADFRPLLQEGTSETDVEFATRLTKEAGVTVIPVSAFYVGADKPRHLVRFCFCKTDDKLRRAIERLMDYFGQDFFARGIEMAQNGHLVL